MALNASGADDARIVYPLGTSDLAPSQHPDAVQPDLLKREFQSVSRSFTEIKGLDFEGASPLAIDPRSAFNPPTDSTEAQLRERVQTLEQKHTTLQTRLDALEKRIHELEAEKPGSNRTPP